MASTILKKGPIFEALKKDERVPKALFLLFVKTSIWCHARSSGSKKPRRNFFQRYFVTKRFFKSVSERPESIYLASNDFWRVCRAFFHRHSDKLRPLFAPSSTLHCRMSMLVSDKHSCKWSPFLRRTDRKIMLVACHKLLRHETFAWVFDIYGNFPTLWCINFWAKNSPLFIFCIGKMSMVIHLPLLSWTPENGISVHLASRIEKSRKFN